MGQRAVQANHNPSSPGGWRPADAGWDGLQVYLGERADGEAEAAFR